MSESGMGNEIDAIIASVRLGEHDELQRQAKEQVANVRRIELQNRAASFVRGYAAELIVALSERGCGYSQRLSKTRKPRLIVADVMHEEQSPYESSSTYSVTDHCIYLGLSDGAILSSSKPMASSSKVEYLPTGVHLAMDGDIIPLSMLRSDLDPNQQPQVMAYRNHLIKIGAYLLGELPDPGFLAIHLPSKP